ncbi:hypothetical protein [Piscinibacter sp.]|jgi:hypothetical protein|uniref:hypothetical protein n=1 Tax=Piscinibacter sp. TaxID=1903157 RepID=UPI003559C5E5
MAETVAPEYLSFVAAERRAQQLPAAVRLLAEGDITKSVVVPAAKAAEMLRVAARRAAGFFRPSKRTEVVWVEGESELAVNLATMDLRLAPGLLRVRIPVRCDQTGAATVEVAFACGSPTQPAGLYAAAQRRPVGPELIIATWGDALVAFAWQCLLGMVTGIAGATGKDPRGNVLVPVEMAVTARGIEILPMARHRFAGSSGLKTTTQTVAKR